MARNNWNYTFTIYSLNLQTSHLTIVPFLLSFIKINHLFRSLSDCDILKTWTICALNDKNLVLFNEIIFMKQFYRFCCYLRTLLILNHFHYFICQYIDCIHYQFYLFMREFFCPSEKCTNYIGHRRKVNIVFYRYLQVVKTLSVVAINQLQKCQTKMAIQ